jgi:hypothetical protein
MSSSCSCQPYRLNVFYLDLVNIQDALTSAVAQDLITAKEVSIAAPCFMAPVDQTAGAVDASTLVWGPSDWDYGADSVAPEGASVSSYQVLDELVEYYMNPIKFPKMKVRLSNRPLACSGYLKIQ